MECIYCGEALIQEDSYGNRDYICYGDINGKAGDIYKCPNNEGFKNVNDTMEYIDANSIDELEEYLRSNCLETWEEIVCESSCHRVSGSFYTDRKDNLHEGYPC